MAVRMEALLPWVQDPHAAELPAEVGGADLEQRLARCGAPARDAWPFMAKEQGMEGGRVKTACKDGPGRSAAWRASPQWAVGKL